MMIGRGWLLVGLAAGAALLGRWALHRALHRAGGEQARANVEAFDLPSARLYDLIPGPLFQTPGEAAALALEHEVDAVGASSLAGGHKTLVPDAIAELRRLGRSDILVVVGGVIPPRDHDVLRQMGVAEVFGPGSVIPICAQRVLEALSGTTRPA